MSMTINAGFFIGLHGAKAVAASILRSADHYYSIARLTGRLKPRKSPLSRGHLSRPACSHVKQIAKRPGTRGPGGMISGRDFCWAKEAPHVRVQKLPPRDPSGPFRHAALAVRRDLGGVVSHPGLCLRQLAQCGAALQERGA